MLMQLCAPKAGEEIRRHEIASGHVVNYFESQVQNRSLESSTHTNVYEAIQCERHRLQNQESFLAHEARKLEYQHQRNLVDVEPAGKQKPD